jgi:beta-lactamase superfamily II metal-dependent hydrolase
MTRIFTVELLPARHGDAIWVEYGDEAAPHRVLIDGGATSSTRDVIVELIRNRIGSTADPDFELIVLTHIDADHLAGLLALFADRSVELRPRDVWFNGWSHLPDDRLGAKQAERLSAEIRRRGLPWNDLFDGDAVRLQGTLTDPWPDSLPRRTLPGGLTLTLLSPTYRTLADLKPVWRKEVTAAGLIPGAAERPPEQDDRLGSDVPVPNPAALSEEPFTSDRSEANGASIAFLAEFEGASVLLTGDAHAPVLEGSLRVLLAEHGLERLPVDAFKLPHHGSRYNLSPGLLDRVQTRRFLFSTDGSSRSHHPDPVAVSRIVTTVPKARLEFNYRSDYTRVWEAGRLQRRYGYSVIYPDADERWLTVHLTPSG